MARKFLNINKVIPTLIFSSMLMAFLPLILFGVPGFYGDDFNMLGSLEIGNGIIGSVQIWISEYGLVYRPVGIFFLNSVYAFFGHSENLIYGISLLIYSLFILIVFKSAKIFTNDNSLALFVTLFFSSFPFNATAFLQISSLYMMFTGLSCLLLMILIHLKYRKFRLKGLTLIALIWAMLLLSYEQITGLVAVIFYLTFIENKSKGTFQSFKTSVLSNSLIIIFTFCFMLFFFLSSSNPKVKTVKDLNQITQEKILNEETISKEFNIDQARANTFSESRLDALISKFERSSSFLYNNFSYSLENLVKNKITGSILLFFLFMHTFLILLCPIRAPSREFAAKQLIFGFIWVASTLLPFFLYKSVHIPPYVLLIPSIGLAYFIYGMFWLLPFPRQRNISKYLFKAFLALLVMNFQIQQYGYYFGLKEELSFWGDVAGQYSELEKLNEHSSSLRISLDKKNNQHIFWIEKLVGVRFFYDSINSNNNDVAVVFDKESDGIILRKMNDKK